MTATEELKGVQKKLEFYRGQFYEMQVQKAHLDQRLEDVEAKLKQLEDLELRLKIKETCEKVSGAKKTPYSLD